MLVCGIQATVKQLIRADNTLQPTVQVSEFRQGQDPNLSCAALFTNSTYHPCQWLGGRSRLGIKWLLVR